MSILASFFVGIASVQGQILKDTASLSLLKQGVDYIYNFEFDKAHDISRTLTFRFPDHPVIYLLNGMLTYWENYPLTPLNAACISYENDLRNCIKICEETLNPPDYAEYLLANLGARGLLLMYFADNNLSDNVFPLAKTTYRYIRQSFDYSSFYPDFLFFTGLYNYYREAYPDAHPVYKMLAFIFPKGDRVRGLEEMQTSARNSIMLKAESSFFLSHIYIHYENDYLQAYNYSKYLNGLYPLNLQYQALYIKNLLLSKRYDEAEDRIRVTQNANGNVFMSAQISIFKGIIREKKYNDYREAKRYYNAGLSQIEGYDYYADEYSSYAYFGLSRIAEFEKDKNSKKLYRKKALDLTNYKKVNFDD